MDAGYGIERPAAHHSAEPHERPARYLVVIDAAGTGVARLFLDSREEVAEFDAGAEEVTMMTRSLLAARGATGPEWDRALAGHTAAERAAAEVYTFDV